MSKNSQVASAVASVRDILSHSSNLAKITAKLSATAKSSEVLESNPPQPRKLLRQPLTDPLSTTRYTYADGSSAVLQHQIPNPVNPNSPCHFRTWVDRSSPKKGRTGPV